MAKKASVSSQPGKLVRKSAESIWNQPLSKKDKEVLARIAARQAAGDDSGINFSDVPELTNEQLATAFRPNQVRQIVSVRMDPDVLNWLKSFGPGYSTKINAILRSVMETAHANSK